MPVVPEDTVEIGSFNNRMEAEMWADILRQEDIIAMIVPQAPAVGSFGTSMYFGHALRVRLDQADRAREILKNMQANE